MCERLGVPDLGKLDVLDFGCGCRFAEAIVNNALPVASYTGIDVDSAMIHYLREHVTDPRLTFHHWDAANPSYNPQGFPLDASIDLPGARRAYDVICMFSVITHQLPSDALTLFRTFRRYVHPHGRMFFSATLEDMADDYRELQPQPTASSAYSWRFLRRLLDRSGWRVLSLVGRGPDGQGPNDRHGREMPIQDSVLCAPASALRQLIGRLR
jgi:SAM-dependent methyltransferase